MALTTAIPLTLVSVLLAACGGGRGSDHSDARLVTCADRTLAACRQTNGCMPDVCDACDCTPTYRGCVPAGVVPSPCPALDCAMPMCCGAADACTDGTTCVAPDEPPGCGICNAEPGTCESDAECKAMGATFICQPIPCSCDAARSCVTGCAADADCPEGTACDTAASRCVPRACITGNDCPANFDCTPDGCARRACTDDADCDDYCVLGRCHGARGTCTPPVP